MNYERIVRKIRNGGKLFDENDIVADKAFRVLGKAKKRMMKQRDEKPEPRGQWSNMTKAELAMSGTVETDWY